MTTVPTTTAEHLGILRQQHVPRLAGQHAPYLARQLHLWKEGLNASADNGAIMAPIAARLTDEQIRDVSAYYASLAPTAAGKRSP